MPVLEQVRKEIKRAMSHTTFVHPEKHLLFSIQGRKRLARLSDRVSYIHWDNTTSTIRIYGTEEQQSQAVAGVWSNFSNNRNYFNFQYRA